jgi:hypothetical protein
MGGGCAMPNAPEIREQLGKLLSHQLSLDEFEEWFAPYSWNIHKHGDADAQAIAYAIEHQLSVFDDDCAELRMALTRIHGSANGHNIDTGGPTSGELSVAGTYGTYEESRVESILAA